MILERMRRDPGATLVVVAVAAVNALYLPTLFRGLVDYDDTWLVRDNFILHDFSPRTLKTIFFDTSAETRFILGAEYLPARDMSIAIDLAIWGDAYAGFHLTNLIVYVLALVVWFWVLVELGVSRTLAGLAILFWAIHPAHAESAAWVSERKGLLGLLFAGVASIGYLRFRIGRSAGWLVLAMAAALFAVWSKAPYAFAVAALAGFELVSPVPRHSWRRSLVGLGAIAVVGAAAFVPVIMTATNLRVVSGEDRAPAGWLAMAIGGHGFYLQLAASAFRNAISYPIRSVGPSALDLVIGALGLVAVLASLVRIRRWQPPDVIRIAALIWLFGWLPASRLVLPLKAVLFADRYILFGTLGVTLALGFAIMKIPTARSRNALVAVIGLALAMRALDAQSNWRDDLTLWKRGVVSNPYDDDAWAAYVERLEEVGDEGHAFDALREGLQRARGPRLLMRKALLLAKRGIRADALVAMREAADAGEPRAMANLALMLFEDGKRDEALQWAKRSVEIAPLYAKGWKTIGGIYLTMNKPAEALVALEKAHKIWPLDLKTRHDLGLTLMKLGRFAEARAHLEACILDPEVGRQARLLLSRLPK